MQNVPCKSELLTSPWYFVFTFEVSRVFETAEAVVEIGEIKLSLS